MQDEELRSSAKTAGAVLTHPALSPNALGLDDTDMRHGPRECPAQPSYRLPRDLSFLKILDLLRCPVDGRPLLWDPDVGCLRSEEGQRSYPVQFGIPCLFAPNNWPAGRSDVTDLVKEFYEQTPFPNYDGLDTRDSLRAKARGGVFARLLDEQIPHTANILEVGCGTGQMSNFLGMGWGRTVVGADLCMNSLRLAKGFCDRFEINNAHFVQINLFRPPFAEASFDIVLSNGVLHHTSDCAGAFRSISRLVKPGGFIIIGLYNWLGRLPTLWRRRLIDKFGRFGALLDYRLRDQSETARREAWFMDQYKNPHETKHSIDDVLAWFDATGYDFMSCVPTLGDTEFTDQLRVFEPHSPGRYLDRLSTELAMMLSGGADGGLYIMIGRKRA
jgi:SAM-dependent methyltransferase